MSGVFRSVNRGFDKIFGTNLDGGKGRRKAAYDALPGAPSNEDTQGSAELDRIRRRKGVLTNIFAGDAAQPSVGTKQLLGE